MMSVLPSQYFTNTSIWNLKNARNITRSGTWMCQFDYLLSSWVGQWSPINVNSTQLVDATGGLSREKKRIEGIANMNGKIRSCNVMKSIKNQNNKFRFIVNTCVQPRNSQIMHFGSSMFHDHALFDLNNSMDEKQNEPTFYIHYYVRQKKLLGIFYI